MDEINEMARALGKQEGQLAEISQTIKHNDAEIHKCLDDFKSEVKDDFSVVHQRINKIPDREQTKKSNKTQTLIAVAGCLAGTASVLGLFVHFAG